MAVAAADFYTYARATGTPLPKSKQEEAKLAPAVDKWKKSRLSNTRQEEKGIDAGQVAGLTAIGAAALAAFNPGARRNLLNFVDKIPPNTESVIRDQSGQLIRGRPKPGTATSTNVGGIKQDLSLRKIKEEVLKTNPEEATGYVSKEKADAWEAQKKRQTFEVEKVPETTVVEKIDSNLATTPVRKEAEAKQALDAYRDKWIAEHSTSKQNIAAIQQGIKESGGLRKEVRPDLSNLTEDQQKYLDFKIEEQASYDPKLEAQLQSQTIEQKQQVSTPRDYIESTGAIEAKSNQVTAVDASKLDDVAVSQQVIENTNLNLQDELNKAPQVGIDPEVSEVASSSITQAQVLLQKQRKAVQSALDENTKQALDLYAQTGDPETLKLLSDQPSLPIKVQTSGGEQDTRQFFDKTTKGEWVEDLEDKDINLTNEISSLGKEKQDIAEYNEMRLPQIEEDQNIARYAMDNAKTEGEENLFLREYAKLEYEKNNLANPDDLNVDIGDALDQRDQVRRELAANKALGAKYKLNVDKQSRPFYELDAEGNIKSETLELRGERPVINTEEKRGGGRRSAQSTAPQSDPLDTLVIQNQQLSSAGPQTRNVQDAIDNTGKRVGNLVDTKGLELDQRQYANQADSGSVIDQYGIRPSDVKRDDPTKRPSYVGSSKTPLFQKATPEGRESVRQSEIIRRLSDPNWLTSAGVDLNKTTPQEQVALYLKSQGIPQRTSTPLAITDQNVDLRGTPVKLEKEVQTSVTHPANLAPSPGYPPGQNQVTYVPANPKSLSVTPSELEKAERMHLLNYISAAHGQIKGGARAGGTKMRNNLTPYQTPSDAMLNQLVMKRRMERI